MCLWMLMGICVRGQRRRLTEGEAILGGINVDSARRVTRLMMEVIWERKCRRVTEELAKEVTWELRSELECPIWAWHLYSRLQR